MLQYYAVKNLLAYMEASPAAELEAMCDALAGRREREWVNLGGQLTPAGDVEQLLADIKSGKLRSWGAIHEAYGALWQAYPFEKQRHAFACLLELLGVGRLTPELWRSALDEAVRTQEFIREQVYLTRKKDYDNPFRRTTFRDAEEMRAVVGTPEDNGFVKRVRQQTEAFRELVEAATQRG